MKHLKERKCNMSKKFEIVGNFNNLNIEQATNAFKIEYIRYEDIKVNDFNFYVVDDVDALKNSIEMQGLFQPLMVKRDNDGKFVLISGHRRFKAIQLLKSEGSDKFNTVPCRVMDLDELNSELALITANSTARELTEYEKMRQVVLTKEILLKMQEEKNIPGKIRDLVAKQLKMSQTSVQRYDYVNKNAIPDVAERLKEQKITITAAEELAKQEPFVQATVMSGFKKDHTVSKSDVENAIEETLSMDTYSEEILEKQDEILDSIIDANTKRKSYVVDKANLNILESFIEKINSLEKAYILYDRDAQAYRTSESAIIREVKKMSKMIDRILENIEE